MALLTSASVAVDVLSSRFHTILIVCGQMQFVFFVGVVVRGKCIGALLHGVGPYVARVAASGDRPARSDRTRPARSLALR